MTAAVDTFPDYSHAPDSPPEHGFAITPSDEDELAYVTRYIYVGVIGALTLVTAGGDTVTFPVVPAGTTIKIRAKQVLDTGTDAESIVGLY